MGKGRRVEQGCPKDGRFVRPFDLTPSRMTGRFLPRADAETECRIRPAPWWACSSSGRAPHSHCGGKGFESPQVHQGAGQRSGVLRYLDQKFLERPIRPWRNIPSGPPTIDKIRLHGPMAQLVARLHGMEEVRGSNPLRSTNNFRMRFHACPVNASKARIVRGHGRGKGFESPSVHQR